MGHYIENTGTTKLQFLELWKTGKFADVSLRQWLAFTPYRLVQANLKIDQSVLAKIPTHKTVDWALIRINTTPTPGHPGVAETVGVAPRESHEHSERT